MKAKAFLAATALSLALAACTARTPTAPDSTLAPAGPAADGVGMFGSGGFTPPPDSTHP